MKGLAIGSLVLVTVGLFWGCAGGSRNVPVLVEDRLPWHDDGVWLYGDPHIHNLMRPRAAMGMLAAAEMAGIDFLAVTDHAQGVFDGNPRARLDALRERHPGLLILAGVEWNVPAGDHATVLVEQDPLEWKTLRLFAMAYDRKASPRLKALDVADVETWGSPEDAAAGIRWLEQERERTGLESVIYLNHVSRHGRNTVPEIDELRRAGLRGVEASPGHQREPDRYPTIDRYDPFVAEVGGGYDRLLADGHFGLSAGSDYHNTTFSYYPGVFSVTAVYCPERSSRGLVQGLRRGATATLVGGSVRSVETHTRAAGAKDSARIGELLRVPTGTELVFTIEAEVPPTDALGGENRLDEVEVISNWAGRAEVVHVFRDVPPGPARLEYRLPVEATARPGGFFLRSRGRKRVGGEGHDHPNADFLFYTSATHVVAESR